MLIYIKQATAEELASKMDEAKYLQVSLYTLTMIENYFHSVPKTSIGLWRFRDLERIFFYSLPI